MVTSTVFDENVTREPFFTCQRAIECLSWSFYLQNLGKKFSLPISLFLSDFCFSSSSVYFSSSSFTPNQLFFLFYPPLSGTRTPEEKGFFSAHCAYSLFPHTPRYRTFDRFVVYMLGPGVLYSRASSASVCSFGLWTVLRTAYESGGVACHRFRALLEHCGRSLYIP